MTNNTPHKQATKLIVNDQTWWWYVGGTIVIWEPNHTMHLLNVAKVTGTSFNITKGSKRKKSEVLEKDIKHYILNNLIPK